MIKTWMKALFVLCLSACLAICLASCDGNDTTDPGETNAPSGEQAFETLSPEEEAKDPAKNDIFE